MNAFLYCVPCKILQSNQLSKSLWKGSQVQQVIWMLFESKVFDHSYRLIMVLQPHRVLPNIKETLRQDVEVVGHLNVIVTIQRAVDSESLSILLDGFDMITSFCLELG